MGTKIYGICSNTSCRIIKEVRSSTQWDSGACYFCPKCGSGLITECPHCHRAIYHREGIFCFYCSKPIKPSVKLAPALRSRSQTANKSTRKKGE